MKPILFNTEMVRAILDNRKTVTRRVVKPQPVCYGPNVTFKPHDDDFFLSAEKNWLRCCVCGHDPEYSREGSNTSHHWIPPYRPGEILYVREAFCKFTPDDIINGIKYAYKADSTPISEEIRKDLGYKWYPSIHMPREAARIFLRVTDVHVERLRDINDEEALKEGFGYFGAVDWVIEPFPDFQDTWDTLLKPKDRALYGWEANPWVWVIEFERVIKEEAE